MDRMGNPFFSPDLSLHHRVLMLLWCHEIRGGDGVSLHGTHIGGVKFQDVRDR